jgi:predicted metal-dependent peptidase
MHQPDLLQRTLAHLLLRQPFLATLALRLERRADPTAPTAWADGVHLAVHPSWFADLSDDHRLALVAHECYHVALGHHLRRGTRDPHRWNRACDYAVNALLRADGFTLPDRALFDPRFGDASAEAIYQQLPTPFDTSDPNPTPPPVTGSSPSSSPGTAPPTSPDATSDPLAAAPEIFGEVRDQPSPTPATPAAQEARLAHHAVLITALAQQARAAGRDSAGARRAATLATQPATVDWRALLAEFLTRRTPQDYSWRRPHPRYAALGLYLPLLDSPSLSPIAFVVDTSGSVPKAALDAVTAELEAFLEQHPTLTLDVLYADAEVTGRASYTVADLPLRLAPIGGGGTDFAPALAALAVPSDNQETPACIVYLTDLRGHFPDEPPSIPVLWITFGASRATATAPFGRVVSLPF